VRLHTKEILLSNTISSQPIAKVLRKVEVIFTDVHSETPPEFNNEKQYRARFRLNTSGTSVSPLAENWLLLKGVKSHLPSSTTENRQKGFANVTYEEHECIEFCTAEEKPVIGMLLDLYENYQAGVQRMHRLDENDGVVLRTMEQFLQQEVSLIPTGNTLTKLKTWFAGVREGKWPAETGTSTMHTGQDYLTIFGTHLTRFGGHNRRPFHPLIAGEDKTEELIPQPEAWELIVTGGGGVANTAHKEIQPGSTVTAHQDRRQFFLTDYT